MVNDIIMWIMAVGAVVGGLDRIFGNRLGLGEKFEKGFMLMGPMALSMVGIICLAPVLSIVLRNTVAPLCTMIGVDPAMLGGVLALDMGGYQLCMGLAQNPLIGRYAGILVGAVFGCTVSFTIPMGVGMMEGEGKTDFARGILFGLITMPVALLTGGMLCGISPLQTVWQNLPILLLAGFLLLGLWKAPVPTVKGFNVFAAGIRVLTTVGLILAVFRHMTGIAVLPEMAPVGEAMEVVASVGIVLLGSLPVAELLQRAMKKPFELIGRKTGMNSASVTGLLMMLISVTPAIAMLKDMDKRGRIVNAAGFVSAASTLAAHLGFTLGVEPDMVGALIVAKLAGGAAGILVALLATRRMAAEN